MQVRKKLKLYVFLSAAGALVIVVMLLLALHQVRLSVEAEDLAGRVVSGIFERSTFRQDYLRTNSERARIQWLAKQEELRVLLATARDRFRDPEALGIIQGMIKNHGSDSKLFVAIMENRAEAAIGVRPERLAQEIEERLISRLQANSYENALSARSLQEASSRHLFRGLKRTGAILIGMILLATFFALMNWWTISRAITSRMASLLDGAAAVGAGNLHYRIGMEGDDEFSELSQGLDSMTASLQSSYTELQNQIAERVRAEEALQKHREELEIRVWERTVELESIKAELEMQNEELQEAYRELETETASRMQALEELREKDRLLIQQGRLAALGEMLGNIAHQWRQPLNVLGLLVQEMQMMEEAGKLDRQLFEANTDKAMELIFHLSQTIDDFTQLASPDKAKKMFRVDQIAARTVSLVADSFRNRGIVIELSAKGEPQTEGHPNEYVQVLLNILMNARDALVDRNTPEPRVDVTAWEEDDRTVVTVTDNAGGIDADIIDRIFDPYFSTKEPGRGTGIGLFMSKNIIEKNMGGRLTARNVAGGAEFRIEV